VSGPIAILLDGEFVKKCLQKTLKRFPNSNDVKSVCDTLMQHPALTGHELYRIFYYTADPLKGGSLKNPIDGSTTSFANNPIAQSNESLIDTLELTQDVAVRRGELVVHGWKLGTSATRYFQKNPGAPLQAGHLVPQIEQKGVDMRIGLDIAALALKKLVRSVVLVSGDSDMIPAMKFARREGLRVYLHTMGQTSIRVGLKIHADLII
jgi:uncharacterized LabA/DUF88 family protein